MYAFTQHRPTTLRQAANLLAKQEEAKLLAGGHTLIPTMKLRLARPTCLIDLNRLPGLRGMQAVVAQLVRWLKKFLFTTLVRTPSWHAGRVTPCAPGWIGSVRRRARSDAPCLSRCY